MRVFGYDVSIRKAARSLQPVDDSRGWMTMHDTFPGSWQQDVHVSPDRASAYYAVFACQTLIAGDIGKLGVRLMQWNASSRIFDEVRSNAVTPFMRKPNRFQTWQKFVEFWILSKLAHGNAYILKERDDRNVVVRGYVLDPCSVQPLVSESGEVFYRLNSDRLAGIEEQAVVPASEIMHDPYWCLEHPLVGVSPIYAAGLAATQGLEMQENSARFFRNASVPSGVLVTAQRLDDTLAKQYKDRWETNYGGSNRGRTAVLGNGLEYKRVTDNAVDSAIVEQLKMTAEMVCTAYHVPGYKVGIGATPTYQNAEVLNQIYYDTCLQPLVQAIEASLTEGLELPQKGFVLNLNEDDLLRMDKLAQVEYAAKGVERAIFAPNEARAMFNRAPVKGGESPMAQQQNFSLAALAKRDAKDDPFETAKPPAPPTPAPKDGPDPDAPAKFARELARKFHAATANV